MDKTCFPEKIRGFPTLVEKLGTWYLIGVTTFLTRPNEGDNFFFTGKREAWLLYKYVKFSVEIYSLTAVFSGNSACVQHILSHGLRDMAVFFPPLPPPFFCLICWIQNGFVYSGREQLELFSSWIQAIWKKNRFLLCFCLFLQETKSWLRYQNTIGVRRPYSKQVRLCGKWE